MTLKTKTWQLGDWDRVIINVLLGWRGTRAFRPTLHSAVRAALADDPQASRLVGPGSRSRSHSVRTWADRRVVNVIIMLSRAGLIGRDDDYIHIKDRPGIQLCLDAGSITYSWEKEE